MGSYVASTNSSGIANFGFLPAGTYTLVQLTAPQGYNSISSQIVTINSINKKINLTNSPTNPRTLSITKTDQNGQPLAGAKFKLWDSTGTIGLAESPETTLANNTVSFGNLASTPSGVQYKYNESQVPPLYSADQSLKTVTVKNSNISVTVQNTLI